LKKRIIIFLCGCGIISFFYSQALALQERISDLNASVEVAAVFGISLDNPHLAFGLIGPGKTKVLGEGHFFNEVKCRSNSGRSWYLKVSLVSLRLAEENYILTAPHLKYKIVESTGQARTEKIDFKEFSEQPILIYTSEGEDNRGQEVNLRFQYILSTPADAPAGNYVGQIIFTMSESP